MKKGELWNSNFSFSSITSSPNISKLLKIKQNWRHYCFLEWNSNNVIYFYSYLVHRIPEVSRGRKVMKYLFRLSFYGAVCFGCYKFYRVVVPLLTWPRPLQVTNDQPMAVKPSQPKVTAEISGVGIYGCSRNLSTV